jgi:hypothetical protein
MNEPFTFDNATVSSHPLGNQTTLATDEGRARPDKPAMGPGVGPANQNWTATVGSGVYVARFSMEFGLLKTAMCLSEHVRDKCYSTWMVTLLPVDAVNSV